MFAPRRAAKRALGAQCSAHGDTLCKVVIDGWIYAIDSVAEKRDRRRAGGQRPFMRSRVDSLRQAADDTKARPGKMIRKIERILHAATGRARPRPGHRTWA